MSRITSAQLARMRQQNQSTFDTTVIIKAPSNVRDNAGGVTKGYAPVTGGTALARIGAPPLKRKDFVLAGKQGLEFDYIISLPCDAPINADYHISFDGQEYAIVALSNDQSLSTANLAYVSRLSNG